MILKTSPHLVKIKLPQGYQVLYHSLFGRAVKVSAALSDFIERFRDGTDPGVVLAKRGMPKYKNALADFRKRGFLIGKKTDEYALLNKYYAPAKRQVEAMLPSGKHINSLRLELAGCCNFQCRHCFAHKLYEWKKSSLMSPEVARRAVDGFVEVSDCTVIFSVLELGCAAIV